MRRYLLLALFTSQFVNISLSQSVSDSLINAGNKFYKSKDYKTAGEIWSKAAALDDNKISRQEKYYYTANAFANAKDSINSLKYLEEAVYANGFNDVLTLKEDDSFNFIHQSSRWIKLINSIKPVYTSNPLDVKVIDDDVKLFWKANEKVKQNPEQAEKIYRQDYLDKGSLALQYYYKYKINTASNFAYMHKQREKYYESIKANTLKAALLKEKYKQSFVKLKKLYPQAVFPPIYFVVGKLNSGGTSCSYGLILAIDQACMSPTANVSELSNWEKHNISSFEGLPHTVAHELIHYLQNGMGSDTTLLKAAIVEGMADFLGELISGKTANERLKVFAKGKEKQIWQDFQKEMYLDRAYNWIANSEQETEEKPADLGYWVGYEICKSYYQNSTDKKKAIYAMLHIQDYKKFLTDSRLEAKYQ